VTVEELDAATGEGAAQRLRPNEPKLNEVAQSMGSRPDSPLIKHFMD
jgi:hypothetical protein